ncbi:MAG: NUDIX domain-containing protein [Candidatus Thermoplasmatota archaeon]|jgi:8-oxo-dGTP pyrophosphatase MutT (NUDIX family)|nr:NUDIX domain-containing protein [Candidatus Thermoplasmatota archaeon]MCL5964099.1 NUDIX domain-containing protein [Candidatus Thermoplasmatota archaeon]
MKLTKEPVPGVKTVNEFSSGTVIVDDDMHVLLVHQIDEDRWCLPKGHIDDGETEIETAIRETEEETGLKVKKIVKPVGTIAYSFYDPVKLVNVNKKVTYYIAKCDGKIRLEPIFDKAIWCSLSDAERRITTETEREIIKKVHDSIIAGDV